MSAMLETRSTIGPYEIQSLLGAGGMGEVYRARDTRLQRSVAVKILPPHVASDAGRRQRFEQEARAASGLNHPNIVSVYDIGEQKGLAYIVSELVEGESLREVIRRGPVPVSKLADWMGQTADGLAAAHAAGIVHRDIKPENLIVTRDGRVKILDFGLAKQAAAAASTDETQTVVTHTSPGTVLGTAAYMSPEQVRGAAVDHRSDIFSLGLVIAECVMVRHPFQRPTSVEMMTAILREDPAELPETTAPALRQIVWHCLEKEPEARFQSARDLGFALKTVTSPTRASGISQSMLPAPGRTWHRKWLWPLIAGLLFLGVISLAAARLAMPDPIDLNQYHLTPFATGGDPQSEAAWSPDGKSIAYVKTIGGIPQLMVRELSAPTSIQLTHSADPVAQPFWAPGSSLLYYVTPSGAGTVWAISPAGGKATQVITGLYAANISPDGKTLAIWEGHSEGANVRGSVMISSPPGAAPKRYSPEPFGTAELSPNDRIAFSPDGTSILLLTGANATELWLLPYPAGRAAPRKVMSGTDLGIAAMASWFPDSRHAALALAPGLRATHSLWLADLTGGQMRRLTADTLSHEDPSVAPDGRRLVFATRSDDYDLVSLPLDGGPSARLLENSRNEVSPSWSPQGDQIIYSTDRTGQSEIWIRNLKAGIDRRAVSAHDFPNGATTALTDPIFSPDGNRFAFLRYSSDEPVAIWFAPTAGGAPIKLAQEQIQSPAWAPDGNSIAGLVKRNNPWQPAVVGVGANMTARLVHDAPFCFSPLVWSPAGNWLACEAFDGISLFTPDGSGQSKKLPKLHAEALTFSRDGKTLYAVGREHGRSFLKAVDVSSASVRVIADYGTDVAISGGQPMHARLSLAPDGKSLATSVVIAKADLWLLEGFPTPRPWWRIWR